MILLSWPQQDGSSLEIHVKRTVQEGRAVLELEVRRSSDTESFDVGGAAAWYAGGMWTALGVSGIVRNAGVDQVLSALQREAWDGAVIPYGIASEIISVQRMEALSTVVEVMEL